LIGLIRFHSRDTTLYSSMRYSVLLFGHVFYINVNKTDSWLRLRNILQTLEIIMKLIISFIGRKNAFYFYLSLDLDMRVMT